MKTPVLGTPTKLLLATAIAWLSLSAIAYKQSANSSPDWQLQTFCQDCSAPLMWQEITVATMLLTFFWFPPNLHQ